MRAIPALDSFRIYLTGFAWCCVLLLGLQTTHQAHAGDQAEVAGDTDGERTSEKLIPDQKSLAGMPATIINLAETFADTAVDTGEPLTLSVEHNTKEKVAVASIDQGLLTIGWGKVGKTEITVRAKNSVTNKIVDVRFNAKVWHPDYWMLAMTVLGGLGIFLLTCRKVCRRSPVVGCGG